MRKRLAWMILAGLVGAAATTGAAVARGGVARDDPFAGEHIDMLPGDIRSGLARLQAACGGKAAATHYFSTTIDAGGESFRSLHFEDFACPGRAAVCKPTGCLHEIYRVTGGRSRRVFSAYVQDVRMVDLGGVAGLVVTGSAIRVLRWNGRAFVGIGNE